MMRATEGEAMGYGVSQWQQRMHRHLCIGVRSVTTTGGCRLPAPLARCMDMDRGDAPPTAASSMAQGSSCLSWVLRRRIILEMLEIGGYTVGQETRGSWSRTQGWRERAI